jgi:hypothetical protein
MTPADKRRARAYQAKHRGTKRSHVTELEDALIMLAWEAELLSEGQVSHLLDVDRVTLRLRREAMLDGATKLAEAMYAERPTEGMLKTRQHKESNRG